MGLSCFCGRRQIAASLIRHPTDLDVPASATADAYTLCKKIEKCPHPQRHMAAVAQKYGMDFLDIARIAVLQQARVSIGGRKRRLVMSNAYGDQPVRIGRVTVGRPEAAT